MKQSANFLQKLKEKNRLIAVLEDKDKKKLGWVLVKRIEPSEKTKKKLGNIDKYDVYWNPKTGEVICDCIGFVMRGYCKHQKEWQEKIKSLLNKKQNNDLFA